MIELAENGWADEPLEEDEEDETEEEQNDELFYEIYVEIASNLIHEVQMFDTFVLVRPASPNLYLAIRKLDHVQFSKEFREYGGDAEAVRLFLKNAGADFLVES